MVLGQASTFPGRNLNQRLAKSLNGFWAICLRQTYLRGRLGPAPPYCTWLSQWLPAGGCFRLHPLTCSQSRDWPERSGPNAWQLLSRLCSEPSRVPHISQDQATVLTGLATAQTSSTRPPQHAAATTLVTWAPLLVMSTPSLETGGVLGDRDA